MIGLRTLDTVFATRDNNFNFLRMIAATGVLVSHAYPLSLGYGAEEPLSAFLDGMSLGSLCVLIFFSISGFFITKSYYYCKSWKLFLLARILRLFPALIIVLLVTILVGSIFLTQADPETYWSAAPIYFLRNLTLYRLDYDMPGVFLENPYGMAINGSLWTLLYEAVCYIGVLVAGLLGLIHRPRWAAPVLAAAVLLCLVMPYLSAPGRIETLARLGLPFAIGAGFFIWRAFVPLSFIIAIGLALLAWACHGTEAFKPVVVLSLCYSTFVLGYWPSQFLNRYNRIGDYSYGTYLYAFPIQQIIASMGVTDPMANIALALPATLICAMLSWHLVEHVALKFKPSSAAVSARNAGSPV